MDKNMFLEVTLSEGIEEIENYAFSSCEKLEQIILPNSLKRVGKGAFLGCSALKKIILPYNLTEIEEDAFKGCNNLTIHSLNNKIPIHNRGFEDCYEVVYIG